MRVNEIYIAKSKSEDVQKLEITSYQGRDDFYKDDVWTIRAIELKAGCEAYNTSMSGGLIYENYTLES